MPWRSTSSATREEPRAPSVSGWTSTGMWTTGRRACSPRTTRRREHSPPPNLIGSGEMRIEFDIEIFTKDAPVPPVISLLECVTAGRHDWVADPETLDAADSYFRVHVPTMRSGYSELGRKGAVDASWRPVTGNDARVRIMLDDVQDVAADLCRSAVVGVQDQQPGGLFLRSIARGVAPNPPPTALKKDWR